MIKLFVDLFKRKRLSKRLRIVNDHGEGNKLKLDGVILGKVVAAGNNNRIIIPQSSKLVGDIRIHGNSNLIALGEHCEFHGRIVIKGRKQRVTVGNGSYIGGAYILSQERCNVDIGRNCLFSRQIEIRTTDAHSVIERSTGKRLNPPASIRIGNHVWMGLGVLVSKGAVIPEDSIVGAKSFVNRAFDEEGVILAGTPAVIVKRGITWDRGRKEQFTEEEMSAWLRAPMHKVV